MRRHKLPSSNDVIFKSITSKLRRFDGEMPYTIIFSFLYKYCSDSLKEYFLTVIEDKELTLDEAYQMPEYQARFKEDALNMFGYYIEKPEAFIDEVMNDTYSDNLFIAEFFKTFSSNVVFFKESNTENYFNFIFEAVWEEISNINVGRNDLIFLKDIIIYISKLDINDEIFSFAEVFDFVSNFLDPRLKNNSEYLNNIFSAIVAAEKFSCENIYSPFCSDASSIINLSKSFDFRYTYGKESHKLMYCCAIVKLFLNYFNLDNVFLKNGDATESFDLKDVSFDVILSKIPDGRRLLSSNKNQNLEITKRNRRDELEEVLRLNFNIDRDSFAHDMELNSALENLIEKMDFENASGMEFLGEYESLRENEFLFLINLINTLKKDGMMIVSISQNFLFKNSLTLLRKYLTYEMNYVDTVISIPNELGRKIRPDVIIIFKKNRNKDDLLFIDLSNEFSVERINRRVPGLFRRSLVLDDDTVRKLVDVYSKRAVRDKFSNLVRIDEIEKNNFNLSISRYVDTYDGEFVKLEELKHEKKEITDRIKVLNEKIDLMMEELNINFK